MEVNIVFPAYPVNGALVTRRHATPIVSQLFEDGEYAKLTLDEKRFSHPWDDWNRFSPPL
jgi:hypothetical protein